MTYTQAQADALREAIAMGATRVETADKVVEFRSVAEMERLLAIMEAQLEGSYPGRVRKVARFSRGHFNQPFE